MVVQFFGVTLGKYSSTSCCLSLDVESRRLQYDININQMVCDFLFHLPNGLQFVTHLLNFVG